MAKRPTTRKPKRETPAALVSASITYSESAARFGTQQTVDRDLVARACVNSIYSACNMNAVACSAQTIRLYRKAKSGGKTWGQTLYPGMPVKDRRRLAWLRGQGKHRPGRKALAMASSAEEIEEVPDHPALDLLYFPDEQMPAQAWWWLLYFFGECAGRSYIYKGERSGPPVSLYLLAPQYVQIEASKTEGITGYHYGVESAATVRYASNDVVYHRSQPNPFRPLQALSWLHSVRLQSDLEQAAIQSEIARWNNGGNPSMVLTLPADMTQEQVQAVESRLRNNYTGVNKAGTVMVLQNATMAVAGHKPNEMQYVEGGRRSEELIYRAAGIPEPMWKMNDSNRASAGQADPQYMGQTILPRLNNVAETLTEGVLTEFPGSEEMWFAYDNPVAEDRAADVLELTTLSDKGIVTGNEVRAGLGYDPAGPELDVLRYAGTPLTVKDNPQPIGAPNGQAPDEEEVGEEVPGGDGGNAGDGDGSGDGGSAAAGEANADGANGDDPGNKSAHDVANSVRVAGVGAGQVELKWIDFYKPCPCTSVSTCNGEVHKAIAAVDAESELARYMEDWYQRAVGTIGPDGRPNLTTLSGELEKTISRLMGEIFANGGNAMIDQLGGDDAFNVMSDDAVRYVNEKAGRLIQGITETVRDQVATAVQRAVEAGEPLSSVQQTLRDAGFAEHRAEVVARTETIQAYNAGSHQAAKDLGVETKTHDLSGNPCEVCTAINAAQTGPIPLAEPFARAGQTFAGVTLKMDVITGSEVHPQCSCSFTPVLI